MAPNAHPGGPRRSRGDRMLAGILGGLGGWLRVDPFILRALAVALALAVGAGVVLYALAWLLMPLERPGEPAGPPPPRESRRVRALVAGVLVGLGAAALIRAALLVAI